MAYDITLKGDKELLANFEKLASSYFNYAYNGMRRAGNRYKKGLKRQVEGSLKQVISGNLTKGIGIEGPKGYASKDLMVGVYGETPGVNPHWHLVETGHDSVIPDRNQFGRRNRRAGETVGHVAGKQNIDAYNATGEPERIVEEEMLKSLDKALKAGGFS